ncbi:MAG: hypothetical protein ACI4JX_05270 [Oscillospiraceae bacterium]
MNNLAYDFARFDVTENKKTEKKQEKSEIQMVVPRAKKASYLKGAAFAMFAIAVCSMMLYSGVMVNEAKSELNDETAALTVLQSEGVRLESKLDNEMSLKNVEEYAVSVLGMKSIEASNMEYIKVPTSDTIKTADAKSGKGFFAALSNGFDSVMEYLGL